MTLTITLPDELAARLQAKAETQQLPLEEVALKILSSSLELEADQANYLTLEEIVAKIKETPANPASIRPASGSLAEALKSAPDDPEFDLKTWNREWAKREF